MSYALFHNEKGARRHGRVLERSQDGSALVDAHRVIRVDPEDLIAVRDTLADLEAAAAEHVGACERCQAVRKMMTVDDDED